MESPEVKASKAPIPTPVLWVAVLKVPVVAWPINKEFEKFVNESNIKANLMLQKNDPERFIQKYGEGSSEKSFVKQT